ncbi:hypothetical protein GOV06_03545 [Candidatus Woesearchaeota archaeon]|nr:hypothetical protein [Candidatus Woesearchaeota archaeon]
MKTIDGVFGPSTELDEGFIEGAIRSVPFTRNIGKILKEYNKNLDSWKYWCGKTAGFVVVANLYITSALMLYESLK